MTESVRHRLTLLASVGGAMIVALDGTVLIVAQPSLQRGLGASMAQVQWTNTAYLLAVAALLELAATAAVAAALVMRERRSAQPIVPPAVARSLPVTASMAILLLVSGGLFGALFVATFYLQDRLGLNPLAGGLLVLPMTALMVVGAPVAAAALRRYGPRHTAIAGTVLLVLGIAALSRLGPGGVSVATGVSFAVLGAGFATVMVTATGTVVGDAPPGYAGVVGGLKQTAMNIGPTLGIAVATSVMLVSSPAPAMGPALLVLAVLAALALLPASLLPRLSPRAGQKPSNVIHPGP
ncbi:MAG TPA: MFS transporter [Nonomuraea sp.]|nr:MFS transporter [Nonomuraea sp.]